MEGRVVEFSEKMIIDSKLSDGEASIQRTKEISDLGRKFCTRRHIIRYDCRVKNEDEIEPY